MKTAVIFDLNPEEILYFVVEGDYRDCNGHYVNASDDSGVIKRIMEDIQLEKNKVDLEGLKQAILEGTELIQCGFYL